MYHKSPRLYTLGEICIVLGDICYSLGAAILLLGTAPIDVAGTSIGLVFLSGFFVHEDTLKDLGIRVDNLPESFKEASVATVFCVALFSVSSCFSSGTATRPVTS